VKVKQVEEVMKDVGDEVEGGDAESGLSESVRLLVVEPVREWLGVEQPLGSGGREKSADGDEGRKGTKKEEEEEVGVVAGFLLEDGTIDWDSLINQQLDRQQLEVPDLDSRCCIGLLIRTTRRQTKRWSHACAQSWNARRRWWTPSSSRNTRLGKPRGRLHDGLRKSRVHLRHRVRPLRRRQRYQRIRKGQERE
jgi:hypothetical protein